jgi:cytochrome b subunit of formate dehydrogenase
MNPAIARPLLHTVHLLTFLILLATGLMLFSPTLRSTVTGGYSLVLYEIHCWSGVAFVVLPMFVVLRFGPRSIHSRPPEATLRALWQGLHAVITVLLGGVLAVTGFVLWAQDSLPQRMVDSSLQLHGLFTWIVAAAFAVHLFDVGLSALAERFGTVSKLQE